MKHYEIYLVEKRIQMNSPLGKGLKNDNWDLNFSIDHNDPILRR